MFAQLKDMKPFDRVVADNGFSCLKENTVYEVQQANKGLAVLCSHGVHLLDGQTNEKGEVVGLTKYH